MKDKKIASSSSLNHALNNNPGSSTAAASTRSLESLTSSVPSSPVVEPPTPCNVTAELAQIPPIDKDLLRVEGPSQFSAEESSGTVQYPPFIGYVTPQSN